jgi:hypothetical protein
MSAQSDSESNAGPMNAGPSNAGPSRRSMLRGAGAAGAVGIAAVVGVGAASGVAAAAPRPAGHRDVATERSSERPAGQAGAPLVVYLRDAAAGELELFAGTSRTVVVDRDLAARLARAAG